MIVTRIFVVMFNTSADGEAVIAFNNEQDAQIWIKEKSAGFLNGYFSIQEIDLNTKGL